MLQHGTYLLSLRLRLNTSPKIRQINTTIHPFTLRELDVIWAEVLALEQSIDDLVEYPKKKKRLLWEAIRVPGNRPM